MAFIPTATVSIGSCGDGLAAAGAAPSTHPRGCSPKTTTSPAPYHYRPASLAQITTLLVACQDAIGASQHAVNAIDNLLQSGDVAVIEADRNEPCLVG